MVSVTRRFRAGFRPAFRLANALLLSVGVMVSAVSAQGGAQDQQSARQPGDAPRLPNGVVPPPGYVIGSEDVLTVVFWREKDLSGDVIVRPDGKISLPLINELDAAGLTPEQLRARVTEAAGKFVQDPTVSIVVKAINSRKVFITGQVSKSGQFPLAGPTTVMQLIAMAGGLQEYADPEHIVILREEAGKQVGIPFNYKEVLNRKKLTQNIELKAGDTVVVP